MFAPRRPASSIDGTRAAFILMTMSLPRPLPRPLIRRMWKIWRHNHLSFVGSLPGLFGIIYTGHVFGVKIPPIFNVSFCLDLMPWRNSMAEYFRVFHSWTNSYLYNYKRLPNNEYLLLLNKEYLLPYTRVQQSIN